MADRIKGIKVEIGGETQGLSKALAGVNKDISNTQSQLKEVERLLKLDPGNTELLAQKQRLLGDAVRETRTKLEALKEAERQAQEQFERGEISQEQYDALKREIIKTENELENLEEQANQSNSAVAKIGDAAKKMGDKLTAASKAFAPISAAGAAVATGLGAMAVNAGKSADDINTLAKVTGLSTEQIQKFAYATDLIDVSMDTLTGSMSKMIKNMATARKGTGDAAEAFKTLRVRFKNADGSLRDSQTVFSKTITALGKVRNETERNSLAMAIFGKSAQELNPLILGGAEQLEQLGKEAEAAGLILSQEALDGANAFNDELDSLKATASATAKVVGSELAAELLPVMKDLAVALKGVMEWVRGLDGESLKMIAVIGVVLGVIAPLLALLGQMAFGINQLVMLWPKLAAITKIGGLIKTAMAGISGTVGGLASAFSGLVTGIGSALSGAATAIAGFLGISVGALAAIVAAVVAVIAVIAVFGDEIQAGLQKVDDFLQNIFTKDWTESFGAVGEVVNAFFANIKNIWDSIKQIFDGLIDFIRGVFTGDWERAWSGVVKIFGGLFKGLVSIALAPINMIIGMLNWLIDGLNALLQLLNKIKLPDFLGGGQLFNFGEISKINYLSAEKITGDLGKVLADSPASSSGASSPARRRAEQAASDRDAARQAAAERARLQQGQTVQVNNYNSINADNLTQVARMERVLNGQRQSMRMGYVGR